MPKLRLRVKANEAYKPGEIARIIGFSGNYKSAFTYGSPAYPVHINTNQSNVYRREYVLDAKPTVYIPAGEYVLVIEYDQQPGLYVVLYGNRLYKIHRMYFEPKNSSF